MDELEPPYLHGALTLIEECDETIEALSERYELADDAAEKSKLAEAARYELKIRASIEELLPRRARKPCRRGRVFATLSA